MRIGSQRADKPLHSMGVGTFLHKFLKLDFGAF